MSTPAMHLAPAGGSVTPEATCDQCTTLFRPRRGWARFCSAKCRNAWHSAMRPESVREARELVRIALEGAPTPVWTTRARKLLGIK